MKKKGRKKKESGVKKFFLFLILSLWFVIKIPYFIVKGIIFLIKKLKRKNEEDNVEQKRKRMNARYQNFAIIKKISGNFEDWEKGLVNSESTIGLILGARGTGKTAIGIKILENIYSKEKKNCYAMGFKKEEMPSWINVVEDVSKIKNNSAVLIDEGGILFSSRKSMTNANKILSELLLIARHKNLSIIFISQNSSNIEINTIRQADYIILKPSSLLQKDFERKRIKEIYNEVEKDFKKLKDKKGITYIYSEEFRGFITNPLPSFWNQKISKSFE